MSVEIERKFLVRGDEWTGEVTDSTEMVQGYLSVDPARIVRVRVAGERAFLTVKGRGPTPDVRPEFEYEVPVGDAREMLLLAVTPAIHKVRHRVPAGGGLTWEVDVFAGTLTGLRVAEIELPTPDTAFARPAWLGADVTDDPRYSNSVLSLAGAPA